MKKILDWLRRYPLAGGLLLIFAFTWPLDIWMAAQSHGVTPFQIPPFLHLFIGYGIVLAALSMAFVTGGRDGVVALLRRFLIWRVGLRWYVFALFAMAAINLAAIGMHFLISADTPDFNNPMARQLVGPEINLWLALPFFFLIDAVLNGEEIGWRGYLLPRLQGRAGALAASLVIGVFWSAWHLPRFFALGNEQSAASIMLYFVRTTALAVIYTWLFNHTRGSLLLATLFHAASNTAGVFLPVGPAEAYVVALTVLVALAVLARSGAATLSPAPPEQASKPAPPTKRAGRLARGASVVAIVPLVLVLAGANFQAVATAIDEGDHPLPGRLVPVGERRLHLHCTGAGEPTVILAASYPATVSSWVWIQPQIAAETRVCAYDRGGAGWSEAGAKPRSLAVMAEELHTLLAQSGEPGPYVLVGHSWGGGITRLFADSYRGEVAGLVWIEAIHPDGWAKRGLPESTLGGMPEAQVQAIPVLARLGLFRLFPALRGPWGIVPGLPEQQQAELTAYFNSAMWADEVAAVEAALPASLAQLRGAGSLGETPLAVVIGGASPEADEIGQALQSELAALSSASQLYRVEGADHSSLVHDRRYAEETGRVILEVVRRVRE